MNSNKETLIDDLKTSGISAALIRKDGISIYSTITLSETGPAVFANVANICDAISKESGDTPKEIEVGFSGMFLVILPVSDYLLCGIVKDRELKKLMRECADKLAKIL